MKSFDQKIHQSSRPKSSSAPCSRHVHITHNQRQPLIAYQRIPHTNASQSSSLAEPFLHGAWPVFLHGAYDKTPNPRQRTDFSCTITSEGKPVEQTAKWPCNPRPTRKSTARPRHPFSCASTTAKTRSTRPANSPRSRRPHHCSSNRYKSTHGPRARSQS